MATPKSGAQRGVHQRSILSFFGGSAADPACATAPALLDRRNESRGHSPNNDRVFEAPTPATVPRTRKRVVYDLESDDDDDNNEDMALLRAVETAERVHAATTDTTSRPKAGFSAASSKRAKRSAPPPSQLIRSFGRPFSSPITPSDRELSLPENSSLDEDEDAKTPSLPHAPTEGERKRVRNRLIEKFNENGADETDARSGGEAQWTTKNKWTVDIRDANKRRPGEKGYNPGTLHIPSNAWDKLTPFQRQFWEIKSANYSTILMFKKGKFYEMYDRDADIGAKELQLNYTGGGRVDMRCVGVPESAFSRHAARLLDFGYRVGRVEQVETALAAEQRKKSGKSSGPAICQRALVRVLTKATLMEEDLLPDFQSRYLLAVKEVPRLTSNPDEDHCLLGICLVDAAVGQVTFGQFEDDPRRTKLETLLARTRPREVLLEVDRSGDPLYAERTHVLVRCCSARDVDVHNRCQGMDFPSSFDSSVYFDPDQVPAPLAEFENQVRDGVDRPALAALGAASSYLASLRVDREIISLGNFALYSEGSPMVSAGRDSALYMVDPSQSGCLVLDGTTLDNLDILVNSSDGSEIGSLVNYMDRCVTSTGKRLLRRWLCRPLIDPMIINDRLDAVEDLNSLEGADFDTLRSRLRSLPDLERGLARLHALAVVSQEAVMFDDTNKRQVKEFIKFLRGVEKALDVVEWLSAILTSPKSRRLQWLLEPGSAIPTNVRTELGWFLSDAFDVTRAEQFGDMTPREGADTSLDRSAADKSRIESDLEDILSEAKRRLGNKSLKWRHQGKEPYQIEVPVDVAKKAPFSWSLKSQSKTCKRYWTPEIEDLVGSFKKAEEELENAQSGFFKGVLEKFDLSFLSWSSISHAMAELDVLGSIRTVSFLEVDAMCRPQWVESDEPVFDARDLRHPCLAATMGTAFVPNDLYLGPSNGDSSKGSIVLLTGPNMGGKSTILRQTCVAAIMAQVGCYVPASFCRMSPVDRIFTRIGAQDRISQGQSTFLVEMDETAGMLRGATKNSLVVLDELGRGTSTFDGFSIAWAVLRQLSEKIRCRTLFSTHYHMLAEYAKLMSSDDAAAVALYCMSAAMDADRKDITFLYRLESGTAEQSRGIYCARLAGIPDNLTARASELADRMRVEMEARTNQFGNLRSFREIDRAVSSGSAKSIRQLQ